MAVTKGTKSASLWCINVHLYQIPLFNHKPHTNVFNPKLIDGNGVRQLIPDFEIDGNVELGSVLFMSYHTIIMCHLIVPLTSPQVSTLSRAHTQTGTTSPSYAVLDTLIWQGLASVIIPGLTINRVCAVSRFLLNRHTGRLLTQRVRRWVTTGIGLGSIPFIIHPIDRWGYWSQSHSHNRSGDILSLVAKLLALHSCTNRLLSI